jgi:hypothetical protein
MASGYSARGAQKIRHCAARCGSGAMTTRIVADSAFGCAGQRCLAASLAVTVGEAQGLVYGCDRRHRSDPQSR